jgi:EAL domain-containing protein (putative c-di-GMP-specific phosphodiesterase class I)
MLAVARRRDGCRAIARRSLVPVHWPSDLRGVSAVSIAAVPPYPALPPEDVPAPRLHAAEAPLTPAGGFAAVRAVIDEGGPDVVYQPQLSLSRLAVAGYEALARFPRPPHHGPEYWFGLARQVGLGPDLEAGALRRALDRRDERPAGTTIAVNVSPSVLGSPALAGVLPADLHGIEIEITEHEHVRDVDLLRDRLRELRDRGARLAIDDVGAGHSGLSRVMDLAPDTLKLDRHLVVGVASDTAKSALIRAVVDFADHIGAGVCAEGVERVTDLAALADLGVGYAQGWAVGMPDPQFRDADPVAVAAGRRSLAGELAPDRRAAPPLTQAVVVVEDVLDRLTTVADLHGLADLVHACSALLGCDHVALSSLTARDGVDTLTQVVGTADGHVDGFPYPLGEYPVTRRCLDLRTVTPVLAHRTGDAAEWRVLAELGFGSALLVPVISQDRPVGLLEVYRRATTSWSRRQIRSARLLSSMLGPVLDGLTPR